MQAAGQCLLDHAVNCLIVGLVGIHDTMQGYQAEH